MVSKCSGVITGCKYCGKNINIQSVGYTDILPDVLSLETTTITTFINESVDERSNSLNRHYIINYYCTNENGEYLLDDAVKDYFTKKYGTITQTLTVANHANDYNFHTVIINDETNETVVDTNSMNICDRLGGVSLKQAASILLNNVDNAKNKVYIGDYFELGGYTWQNNSGGIFTAGNAKYTLVERTSSGNLIFMSSERHKLTSESDKALTWTNLITNNKLETLLLPQLESILGITPVSYTRKSDIPHLTNKRVFLPTEYEIFGKYTYQATDERYNGEKQWEIFRTDKEENRKIFRRDVSSFYINSSVESSDYFSGYGYWLATNCSNSGDASYVYHPDNSYFGMANRIYANCDYNGVRPCFML